jgi:hypothetical protein
MEEARGVTQIRLSDQEQLSGVMDPGNLVEVLVALHRDGWSFSTVLTVGIVVLNNAVLLGSETILTVLD